MTMQTLTIGKRKFVLIAERDFRRSSEKILAKMRCVS